MATVVLMIIMTVAIKILGFAAHERGAADRRQRAVLEAGNVMERITAYSFDEVTSESVRRIALPESAREALPGSELALDVTTIDRALDRAAKRITVRLRCAQPRRAVGSAGPTDVVDRTEEGPLMTLKPRFGARRSTRRGFTLLEVLIVVTGVAALLGVCAVSIQLLLRLSADSQSRLAAAMAIDRLARQLRADVHGCETAQLAGDDKTPELAPSLRLSIEPGHEVTYSPRGESVLRTESRAGKAVRHEEFVFGRSRNARFDVRFDSPRRWVVLVLSRGHERNRTDPPRPFEVIALAGKDRAVGRGPKGDGKP